MSLERTIQLTCPKCSHAFEYTVWDSLNADLDPDTADRMIRGELFQTQCPHCGQALEPNYPLLYNDMSHGIMVQYTASNTKEDIKKYIEQFESGSAKLKSLGIEIPLQTRIVTERVDLIEKAEIFRAGHDDRIIELMKVFIIGSLGHNGQTIPNALHFFVKNGEKLFAATQASGQLLGTVPFIEQMYAHLAELTGFGDDEEEYLINLEWATNYFETHASALGAQPKD